MLFLLFSPFEESRLLSLWWYISNSFYYDLLIGIDEWLCNFVYVTDPSMLRDQLLCNYFWVTFFLGVSLLVYRSALKYALNDPDNLFTQLSNEYSYIFVNLKSFFMQILDFTSQQLFFLFNYNFIQLFFCAIFSYLLCWLSYHNKFFFKLFHIISNFVYTEMILPYLGQKGKRYFPFFLFLFFFIFISNLVGLLPGCFVLTSQLSVTIFFSSICWLGIFFVGVYVNGFKFFSSFYPSKVPFALSTFLMFIELISYLVRIASLSIRLFANIVAGHILLDTVSMFHYSMIVSAESFFKTEHIIVGFFMWSLLLVLIFFELFISLLQAYIFVVLSVIYLNDSLNLHV